MSTKTCTCCALEKPLESFQVRRASADGRTASCRDCLSARDKARAMLPHRVEARQQYAATPAGAEAHRRAKERYADANKEAILKKAREADGERREAMRDSGRRYARSEKGRAASQRATLAHPDRRAARVAVSNAVRDGGLIPMRCEICGAKGEAHHVHYEYPLLVTWLCSKHHKQAHAETIELEQRQQLQ